MVWRSMPAGHAARRLRLVGVPLPIIGIDDFKANKRASGRLKDLADLESLEAGSPPADSAKPV